MIASGRLPKISSNTIVTSSIQGTGAQNFLAIARNEMRLRFPHSIGAVLAQAGLGFLAGQTLRRNISVRCRIHGGHFSRARLILEAA